MFKISISYNSQEITADTELGCLIEVSRSVQKVQKDLKKTVDWDGRNLSANTHTLGIIIPCTRTGSIWLGSSPAACAQAFWKCRAFGFCCCYCFVFMRAKLFLLHILLFGAIMLKVWKKFYSLLWAYGCN